MDYPALKAEIALPKYAGPPPMTDAQIVAALVADTITVTVDVPIADVEGYMLTHGITIAADDWLTANAATNAPVANAVRSLLALFASPRLQTVLMTDPATSATVKGMIGAMAAVGIMTSAQATAILDMAAITTSRAAQIGLPELAQMDTESAIYHIQTARAST